MSRSRELSLKARFRLAEFAYELQDLRESSLIESFRDRSSLGITAYGERDQATGFFDYLSEGPSVAKDSLRGFICTLRKFQNRTDPGSLININCLYHFGIFPRSLVDEWDRMFMAWNDYLDDLIPPPRADFFQGTGTFSPDSQIVCVYARRYFLDAFLLGLYGHSIEPYRTDIRERWTAVPMFNHYAQFAFMSVVLDFYEFLGEVAKLNATALEHLNQSYPE